LLDTHLLLWAAARSARLPREARELLQDDSNDVYYSAASIWEIAIKSSLRRKDFRVDLAQLLATLPEMGLVELPVTAAHAAGVTRLPSISSRSVRSFVDCAEHCGAAYAPDQRCLTRSLSSRRAGGVMTTLHNALHGRNR
jgi:PIN domain nuclease of toxin-antitoxin system